MIDNIDGVCKFISTCKNCWANADGGLWCYGCDKKDITGENNTNEQNEKG